MESKVTFDLGAAVLTTAGEATLEGFRQGLQALLDEPRFRSGMPILVDHRLLDVSRMSANDVRAIGDLTASLSDRIGPSSVAVVVPNTLTFGFVRMGETQADLAQLSVRIFYSLPEAVEWLRSETPAGAS